jgi:hypothetical protein
LLICLASRNIYPLCEITGFHGDEYEGKCLLGCRAEVSEELAASIRTLMMEAASTSQTPVKLLPDHTVEQSRKQSSLLPHLIVAQLGPD